MTTLSTTPLNKSFLSNNKFDFVLRRIPNFTFFVQSVNLPSLTLQTSVVNSPYAPVSVPGNQFTFGALVVNFMIDEDMRSWYEIYDWMYQLANPESFNKRGYLQDKDSVINSVTADASLIIKTNSNNPNWNVNFYGLYPSDLGGVQFSSTEGQEFATSSVTFNYTYFKLEEI